MNDQNSIAEPPTVTIPTAQSGTAGLPPHPAFKAPVPPPVAPQVSYVKRTKVDSLDDLDNEAPDEPYTFELRGQTFTLIAPKDADWVDISAANENPRLVVHVLMPEEDRIRFFALGKVRLRVFQGMMDRYRQHFGLGEPGESAGSALS